MSTTRLAVTISIEDFTSITFLKPYSDEYRDQLIVIREDAFGEFSGILERKVDIQKRLLLNDEDFQEILRKLE